MLNPFPPSRDKGLNIHVSGMDSISDLYYLPPPVRELEEVRDPPEEVLVDPELLVEPLEPLLLEGGETVVVRVPVDDLPLLVLPTEVAERLVFEDPTLTVVVLLLSVRLSGRT